MEVDHPNIIKFYETYRDNKYYRIVMEYCPGGELFEEISNRGKFTESDACTILRQVLSALKHLHDKNIAHRDLKPENIIFVNKSKLEIKLIDFGLSKILTERDTMMKTKLGTPYYVSPEVLEGKGYGKSCDLWAIGVLTYMLLVGVPPFDGRNEVEVFNKIKVCDYDNPEEMSEDAKDFIDCLLVNEPSTRFNVD